MTAVETYDLRHKVLSCGVPQFHCIVFGIAIYTYRLLLHGRNTCIIAGTCRCAVLCP